LSDDISLGSLLLALAILLFCSAFFSGTETALMSLNRYRLRHLAKSGHRGAKLAEQLLKRPDRLIGVILFGNNLINAAVASLITLAALKIGGTTAVAVGTVVTTALLLIFGEVTPKTLGALHPEKLAFPGAWVYHFVLRYLAPISWSVRLMTLISNALLRIFGVRPEGGASHNLTMEELRTILAESGALLPRKRYEIMMRVMELGEITVDDIMIPQNDVTGIDLDDDWNHILDVIRSSGYTRLPVYREAIDNIIGVLHVKRVVQMPADAPLTSQQLETLLDEPYFVPEGTPLNKQLVQFQRSRQRTGFVVDEYGDIQGIVTLEDLLEEIVGEFTSEPEADDLRPRRDESTGSYVVDAGANIRVLNRMMNWKLPTDGPKTLNGLILEKLETIPRAGTGVMLNEYAIEIIETSGNLVQSVRIREPSAPAAESSQGTS